MENDEEKFPNLMYIRYITSIKRDSLLEEK